MQQVLVLVAEPELWPLKYFDHDCGDKNLAHALRRILALSSVQRHWKSYSGKRCRHASSEGILHPQEVFCTTAGILLQELQRLHGDTMGKYTKVIASFLPVTPFPLCFPFLI